MAQYRYGWLPDLPDLRDRYVRGVGSAVLPSSVDLRDHMPPVYDQGSLGSCSSQSIAAAIEYERIKQGLTDFVPSRLFIYYCHDEQTEVLTDRGWKSWASCDRSETLGTVNKFTGNIEFQRPSAWLRRDYDGPLHFGAHRSLDFAVTPNHRMWCRTDRSNELRFYKASEMPATALIPKAPSGHCGIEIRSVSLGRREMTGDDFAALVGLVVSDGWVDSQETTIRGGRVGFCCHVHGPRMEAIHAMAGRIGATFEPKYSRWTICDTEMARWFRANCYDGLKYEAQTKRMPSIVFQMCQRQIDHLLWMFGDRTCRPDGTVQFCSTSAGLIDDLQRLLLLVGKRGAICSSGQVLPISYLKNGTSITPRSPMIFLSEHKPGNIWLRRRERAVEVDHYRGEIFCATVPNGTLITRRNGSIMMSGNCERVMEGDPSSDSGAAIRDGIKSVASQGACSEADWPYDISKFAVQPPQNCYTDAKLDLVTSYARVPQTIDAMRGVLAQQQPFVFGITVYDSFESQQVATTGIVPLPGGNEQMLGGHAILAVGYDDALRAFIFRNSWGSGWGQNGYGMIPYTYLTNSDLASDFWTISAVSGVSMSADLHGMLKSLDARFGKLFVNH